MNVARRHNGSGTIPPVRVAEIWRGLPIGLRGSATTGERSGDRGTLKFCRAAESTKTHKFQAPIFLRRHEEAEQPMKVATRPTQTTRTAAREGLRKPVSLGFKQTHNRFLR